MKLYDIPTHDGHPKLVNAVVEIPKGTSAKYEYDPKYDLFRLDRCLMSAMVYPASYGFIPSTLAEDGDALDVIIYNATPIDKGSLVECKVIGCLNMLDDGVPDYKVLACPTSHVKEYVTLDDVDPVFLTVAENFFQHYKELNNQTVTTHGWMRREQTYKVIEEAATIAEGVKNRQLKHLHSDIL